MKRKALYVSLVLTAVIFVILSCDSSFQGGGSASKTSVTINLSGGNSRSALPWPPQEYGILDALDYIITFSRNGETLRFDAHGGSNLKVNAEAGRWEIRVEAFYQNMPYATGIANAEILAGQNNSVTISMKKAFDDDDDYDDKHDFIFVTGVNLDLDNITLIEGEAETVFATVYPADAFNKGVTWVSSNPKVANVTDGYINTFGTGEAVITATTDDGGFTANVEVTVVSGINEKYFGKTLPIEKTYNDAFDMGSSWFNDITQGNYVITLAPQTSPIPPSALNNKLVVPRGATVLIQRVNIELDSGAGFIIQRGAKLILWNVTIGDSLGSGGTTSPSPPGGGSYMFVEDGGTLVIESGSFLNASSSLVQVENGGSFIMNGGEIFAKGVMGIVPVIHIKENGHFEKNTEAAINGFGMELVAVGDGLPYSLYRKTEIIHGEILRYRVKDGTVIKTGNWDGDVPFYGR